MIASKPCRSRHSREKLARVVRRHAALQRALGWLVDAISARATRPGAAARTARM